MSQVFLAKTRGEVLAALSGAPDSLQRILYASGSRDSAYSAFPIKKRSGGERIIFAPCPILKSAQRTLHLALAAEYRPRPCVHGYVTKRSFLSNASAHKESEWIFKLDLEDFFSSIHFGRVLGLMRLVFSTEEAAVTAAQVASTDKALPQGAPSSPVIANMICTGLDKDLIALAKQVGANYTRYCDDLTFSFGGRCPNAHLASPNALPSSELRRIIAGHGFRINQKKTRLIRRTHRQRVTGVITNAGTNVSREYRRGLRALIHHCERLSGKALDRYLQHAGALRNRPPHKPLPNAIEVARGRLEHLRHVRGGTVDLVYYSLAQRLHRCAGGLPRPNIPDTTIEVAVEGITDEMYLSDALQHFQASGEFLGLDISYAGKGGGDNLRALVRSWLSQPPARLSIALFDRDVQRDIAFAEPQDLPELHAPLVGTLCLPQPSSSGAGTALCIESLLSPAARSLSAHGCRLYFRSEFGANGEHKTEDNITLAKKGGLVAESVIDGAGNRVCLGKRTFAQLVCGQASELKADFYEGFRMLFIALEDLAIQHYKLLLRQ